MSILGTGRFSSSKSDGEAGAHAMPDYIIQGKREKAPGQVKTGVTRRNNIVLCVLLTPACPIKQLHLPVSITETGSEGGPMTPSYLTDLDSF